MKNVEKYAKKIAKLIAYSDKFVCDVFSHNYEDDEYCHCDVCVIKKEGIDCNNKEELHNWLTSESERMVENEEYQEALDFLFDKAAQEYEIDEESCEVNILDCTSHDKYLKPCLKLQELVDKATPKKIEIWNGIYSCPNCKKLFFPITSIGLPKKFCDDCGHAIDWSDEHE